MDGWVPISASPLRFPLMFVLLAAAWAHDDVLPINLALGVPGFPDCVQPVEAALRGVDENAQSLVCSQRPKDFAAQKTVACVGDSITAGVHASGASTTYPSMLQQKLGDGFKVTSAFPSVPASNRATACMGARGKHTHVEDAVPSNHATMLA